MYGFCYEHGKDFDTTFSDYNNIKVLSDSVDSKKLHVCSECMVIAIACNHTSTNAQMVLSWSTCSKNEMDIQSKVMRSISDSFYAKPGAPLMCWSTDGDSTRRQPFDSLMFNELSPDSEIFSVISKLKLLFSVQ